MGDDLKLSGGLSPGCAPSPYPQMGKWGVYPKPPPHLLVFVRIQLYDNSVRYK